MVIPEHECDPEVRWNIRQILRRSGGAQLEPQLDFTIWYQRLLCNDCGEDETTIEEKIRVTGRYPRLNVGSMDLLH